MPPTLPSATALGPSPHAHVTPEGVEEGAGASRVDPTSPVQRGPQASPSAQQTLRRRLLPAPHGGHDDRDAFLPQRSLPPWVRTQQGLNSWLAEGAQAAFPPLGRLPRGLAVLASRQADVAAPSFREVVLAGTARPPGDTALPAAAPAGDVRPPEPYELALPEPLSPGAIAALEHFLATGNDPVQLHFDTELLLSLLDDALVGRPARLPHAKAPAYATCSPTQLTRREQDDYVCCITKEPFDEMEQPVAVRTGDAVHLFAYPQLVAWWEEHRTNPATTLPLAAEAWLRVLPEPSDSPAAHEAG